MIFFNDATTTEISTLSLRDALPIFGTLRAAHDIVRLAEGTDARAVERHGADTLAAQIVADIKAGCRVGGGDRKSTRLNSSHANITYSVLCLKKHTNLKPHSSSTQHA